MILKIHLFLKGPASTGLQKRPVETIPATLNVQCDGWFFYAKITKHCTKDNSDTVSSTKLLLNAFHVAGDKIKTP